VRLQQMSSGFLAAAKLRPAASSVALKAH
jgi:hypothetical protein